jgi:hypothetical protein
MGNAASARRTAQGASSSAQTDAVGAPSVPFYDPDAVTVRAVSHSHWGGGSEGFAAEDFDAGRRPISLRACFPRFASATVRC